MTKNKIGLVVALSMILQIFMPIFYEIGEASELARFDQFITSLVIKKDRNGDEIYSWTKPKNQAMEIDKSEEVITDSTSTEATTEATKETSEPTIVVEPNGSASGQDEDQLTQEVETQEVVEEVETEEVENGEAEEIERKPSENEEADPSLDGDSLNNKALIDKGVGAAIPTRSGQGATREEITINREDSLFINYEFAIPLEDGQFLQAEYIMDLPIATTGMEFNILEGGGKAKYKIGLEEHEIEFTVKEEAGRIKVSFPNYAEVNTVLENSDDKITLEGYFGFEYSFQNLSETVESFEIKLFTAAGEVVIQVKFKEEESSFGQPTKSGVLKADEGKIEWTIKLEDVNIKDGDLIKFTDTIGQGHAYVKDNLNIVGPNGETLAASSIDYSQENNQLVFSLKGPVKGPVSIGYSTKINGLGEKESEKDMAYKNKLIAQLNEGEVRVIPSAEVTYESIILKNGEINGLDGAKVIDWTVTINPNGLNLGDLEFSDKIERGHSFVEGSIMVKSGTDSQMSEVKVTNSPTADKDIKFTLEKVSEKIVITYQTKVDQDSNAGNPIAYYDNTAFIKQGQTEFSARSVVYHNIIAKSGTLSKRPGGKYFIDWKIQINGRDQALTGSLIKDTFSDQELVEDSFKVNNQPYASFGELKKLEDHGENGFTFEFKEAIGSNEYNIKYSTEITDPNMIGKNQEAWVRNTVSLGGYSAYDYVLTKSQVISKTAKDYNYTSREMGWEATINQNMMPIDQAVFEDTLGEGQSFVDGSIKIFRYRNTEGKTEGKYEEISGLKLEENKSEENELDKNEEKSYSSAVEIEVKGNKATLVSSTAKGENPQGSSLTINFGNITDQYKIIYSTEVDEDYLKEKNKENEDGKESLSLSNTAKLTGNQIIEGGESVTAEKEIKNSILTKKGLPFNNNSSIKWQVNLNENNLNLGEVTLSDQLQKGLELDPTSVKLYKMEINEAGEIVYNPEADIKDQLLVDYKHEDRLVEFKFKDPVDTSYIIIFDTDLVEAPDNFIVSNTIKFKGEQIHQKDVKSESIEYSEDDWAGIWAQVTSRGRITIKKVDQEGKALAGAEFKLYNFKLYNKESKEEIGQGISGQDGLVVFRKLELDTTYLIAETQAPDGYEVSSETIERTLTSDDKQAVVEVINLKTPDPQPTEPEIEEKPSKPGSGGGSSRPRRDREEDPVELDPIKPVEPGQEPELELEEDVDEKLLMDFNKEQEKLRQEAENKKDQALEEELVENQYQDLWSKDPKGANKEKDLDDGSKLPKTGVGTGPLSYGLGLILIGLGLGLLKKKK